MPLAVTSIGRGGRVVAPIVSDVAGLRAVCHPRGGSHPRWQLGKPCGSARLRAHGGCVWCVTVKGPTEAPEQGADEPPGGSLLRASTSRTGFSPFPKRIVVRRVNSGRSEIEGRSRGRERSRGPSDGRHPGAGGRQRGPVLDAAHDRSSGGVQPPERSLLAAVQRAPPRVVAACAQCRPLSRHGSPMSALGSTGRRGAPALDAGATARPGP